MGNEFLRRDTRESMGCSVLRVGNHPLAREMCRVARMAGDTGTFWRLQKELEMEGEHFHLTLGHLLGQYHQVLVSEAPYPRSHTPIQPFQVIL